MPKSEPVVSYEEINAVWGNANFGPMEPNEEEHKVNIVRLGLLKVASGYYQGYTSRSILKDLKLITEDYELTAKGKAALWDLFSFDKSF